MEIYASISREGMDFSISGTRTLGFSHEGNNSDLDPYSHYTHKLIASGSKT